MSALQLQTFFVSSQLLGVFALPIAYWYCLTATATRSSTSNFSTSLTFFLRVCGLLSIVSVKRRHLVPISPTLRSGWQLRKGLDVLPEGRILSPSETSRITKATQEVRIAVD